MRSNLNEEKRKTEKQVALFDLVNDIKGCTPLLLSSHRKLEFQIEAFLLQKRKEDGTPYALKSKPLALFLFNDVLEAC